MNCAAVEECGGKAGDQLREGKGGPDQGRLQGQQKGSGKRLGEVLIDSGYITEKELIDVLCMQLGAGAGSGAAGPPEETSGCGPGIERRSRR